jgi:hypothetical protein
MAVCCFFMEQVLSSCEKSSVDAGKLILMTFSARRMFQQTSLHSGIFSVLRIGKSCFIST